MEIMRWLKIGGDGQIIELGDDPLRWEPVEPSTNPSDILNQIEARGFAVKHWYGPDEDGVITMFVLQRDQRD